MKIDIQFKKKKGFIYIMVFLICFPAIVKGGQADKWTLYYTAADGSKYFYDIKSIERPPKTLTRTHRKRIVRPRQKDKKAWMVKVREKIILKGPDQALSESNVLKEFDCSMKKVHTLMRSNFYKDGALLIRGGTGVWQGIDSEPQLGPLYNIVCGS